MRVSLLCSVVSVFLASAAFAQGGGEFPATLKGHAVLPAQTFIDAPPDAPDDLKTSGKYTTGKRVDAVGSVMGKSYERPTGVSLPFKGQPLQGHSGIKVMPDGSFWVLGDRTQAPSGAGYALENRIVLSRALPETFRDCQVQRLALFFRTLRANLITSIWTDAQTTEANVAWTRETYDAFSPYAASRRWLNYLPAEEADDTGLRAAYGPNYERLVELKSKYDPDNVFHLNANIKPA